LSATNIFTVIVVNVTNAVVTGVYEGLFYDTNGIGQQSSGFVKATVGKNGAFTFKLVSGAKTYSRSSRFTSSGFYSNSIARIKLSPLSVQLDLDLTGGNVIGGRISDTNWTAELTAYRATYNARTNIAPQKGKYTILIPGNDADSSSEPGGDSPGTVSVDGSGNVLFAGALADGTKVSQQAMVFQNGQWPLYAPLYSGGGSVISWMTFTNRSTNDLQGLVAWIKPPLRAAKYYRSGFTNETEAVGSLYHFTTGFRS